jgi:succinate dehydrogenase/fumarate reductase cytochrome b subunit
VGELETEINLTLSDDRPDVKPFRFFRYTALCSVVHPGSGVLLTTGSGIILSAGCRIRHFFLDFKMGYSYDLLLKTGNWV